ncbi:MAG: hypothetical protein PHY31_02150 [Smithellaceae bacterium]|nr:hypothetical protein [Smithellaceae bacterium]
MRKTTSLFILLLFVLSIYEVPRAGAATTESDFAMFKRIISPAYKWGENGLLTVPKATTIGRYNFYLAANAQDAGKIEDRRIFLTTGSVMLGTSTDVELGYTKRTFIWDDFKRSDVDMDTAHLKARILHFSNDFIPQISVGINGASIHGNRVSNQGDILFNPYLAATINIPIVNRDYAILSATGVAEVLYNQGVSSDPFYSVGVDLILFKHLYLVAEVQGLNLKNQRQVVNAGAKFKYGWFSVGVGGFNLAAQKVATGEETLETENSYLMAHASFEIPLERLCERKSGEEKKSVDKDIQDEKERIKQENAEGKKQGK